MGSNPTLGTIEGLVESELTVQSLDKEKVMLRAIVVDDETPAREELICLLEEAGGVDVVAEADCTKDAIAKLQDQPCDVLFLDINMPDATGLQLATALRQIKFPPSVVFVTGYSQFALEAFEVRAVDYLLKPVELDRLQEAIRKVEEEVAMNGKLRKSKNIACEKSGKKFLVQVDDVKYCMAKDDYAYVQSSDGRFFATESLSQIEKELEGLGFMRIHRGYLVNLACVSELEPVSGGGMNVRVKDCEEALPVSKRKISTLKKALHV